ncbi:unnamed protein product [Caenorhabditis brenneri]
MLQSRDEYIDNYSYLPEALRSYIPKQLLKNVKIEECFDQNELEYVQKVLDNSNDNLRMYRSAKHLLLDLKVYMKFPLSRKMFPREMGSYYNTVPNFYQTLKKEVLYCKQDLLFYLQSCVYTELRIHKNAQESKFIEHMKKHEERLSGCYEFVKYDHGVFQDIQKPFLYAGKLFCFPENTEVTATVKPLQIVSYEEKNFVEVFDNLISKYPCLFLSNSETKDKTATAVVRIFGDGGFKFVMESELFAAIYLKNPDQKPLECIDVEGHYRTVDYKNVMERYRDQIGDIDFIYIPIPSGLHALAPIATPTGDHCIQAVDAQMGIITETFYAGFFEKITQNTCHMIPKFIAILRKYLPSNIKYRYFINLKLFQKLREELEEFWKPIEDKPMKRVRNVGPQGFTVEDLKKELKYLGYTKIFPEIIAEARVAYTGFFHSLKPSELKTSDMFAAIQGALTLVLLKRYPCLNEFVYRQKVCLHNRTKPCEACSQAIKEAEARIEAEKKAESEQASNSVTATTLGNDAEKEEVSEELKNELVTSEALPIVERDPENLKNSVESSFVEAETKPNPAISESEVSDRKPVLPDSNDQKICTHHRLEPHESCSQATKEAEFEHALSSVTATISGDDVEKEESIEASKPESVTNEAPEKTINTPVEAEINSLPAISEAEYPEHNPILPDSNTHICEKCMETSNEAREEVIEAYRKIMILEKKLKEKDAELERLKVFEEKSKKSDETEKKIKDLEKEAEELKIKHLKILEENVKMGNMLKSTGNSKALESQVKEKNEQLKVARQALGEKDRKFQKLEKTIKEKDEEIYDLSEVLNQEKEGFKASLNGLLTQLVDKDKEIVELKKARTNAEASWLEEDEKLKKACSELVKATNFGLEQLKIKDSKIQELELKNSKLTEEKNQEIEKLKNGNLDECEKLKSSILDLEKKVKTGLDKQKENNSKIQKLELKNSKLTEDKNQEIEKLKKQQAMAAKENKKEMEQLKRNASESADELKKLTARIAEKEAAENLLKRTNKGHLEKLQKFESSLKEVTNRRINLETEVAEKNRKILELEKSAEKQVSDQEKAKEELEAEVSTIRAILDRISPRSDCVYCLEEMNPDQKTLKCEHCRNIVHLECASKWLKGNRSCPNCRREQLDPTEFPRLQ